MSNLNKEKCYEALGYLFNHTHNCTNCDRVNIGCDECEIDNTMECGIAHFRLSELIEEHFGHTLDFKHFKLYSKSYLKTFKKDELIDYIYMIYHNWENDNFGFNNVMKYAESLQKRIDELESNPHEVKEVKE